MNYTTIEQSKKLVELGLNPYTADMYWDYDDHYTTTPKEKDYSIIANSLNPSCGWDNIDPYLIPCWSLGALLELLRSYNDCNSLSIFTNRSQKWQITISYYDIVWKEYEEININLFEAVYNTVVWLLENGYIKTEKK